MCFAKCLRNCMKGGGTDDFTLIRIIASRCEIFTNSVGTVVAPIHIDREALQDANASSCLLSATEEDPTKLGIDPQYAGRYFVQPSGALYLAGHSPTPILS
ncbi:unnamed protein product [Protopolystoma xenopodis]|uniref:Uncharacterized protein n=1 Tax=Protopolystoma xenopodis TaxID=117903 RepID=A0A448WDA7_9PLAT|nr:unnamed protein product [Protopolystoma xenopodis]